MSEPTPYETLGIAENASFDEIQSAKQRLNQQYRGDSQVLEAIEAAYDAIIMERLRLRKEGRIRVPEGIRFPERSVEAPPNVPAKATKTPPSWLQGLLDTPSQADILWPTLIFFGLVGMAFFSQAMDTSFLASLMALGGMASVYFLNRKEKRFGRAILITLMALIAGIALASGLAVAFPAIPLPGEQLACLLTFAFFWLSSCFLR